MSVDDALAKFPVGSRFRDLIRGLFDANDERRDEAYKRLQAMDRLEAGEDPLLASWKVSEPEAIALLDAVIALPFPPPRFEWNDAVHDLVFLLVRSPHKCLVAQAEAAYAIVSHRARSAILAILAACGTQESAQAFMCCIRKHGWPSGVYARVFSELPKLLGFSCILFPDIIDLAGENIGGVTDMFVSAVRAGKLNPDADATVFVPTARKVAAQLDDFLAKASHFQSKKEIAWRFDEKYWPVRQTVCAWLDLAGYLRKADLDAQLQSALALNDPRILSFAAASILRRGGIVPNSVFVNIAACHETRDLLFELLRDLDRLDLFPEDFRTWDDFAASNMVNWLIYPTELAKEPDELELMAIFTSRNDGKELALYVWRFRCGEESWFASTSGPYAREGEPCPLHGDLTFSRFDKWESATPERHAEATLETLEAWRLSWEKTADA